MNALNPNHPMSQLLACVIWKLRKHCPNLAVEISTQDMEQLAHVFMANGQRGIVAFRGMANGIQLLLVDEATGHALAADKALDENSPNAKMMARCTEARKRAAALANRLRHDADLKKLASALAYDAAEALELLVWEPEPE